MGTISVKKTKSRSSFWKLLLSITICEVMVLVGYVVSQADTNLWYITLNKPSWNPPAYLFGPIWMFLYLLMAIAIWLVWQTSVIESKKITAELVFAFQLFLNFGWSILFYRFHTLSISFYVIILLMSLIIYNIVLFRRIYKFSAWLLLPYLFWISYIATVNYQIWQLNKSINIEDHLLNHKKGTSPWKNALGISLILLDKHRDL